MIVHLLILIIFKNIFLVLGKSPTYDINGSFGTAVKKLDIFTKENTKLCISSKSKKWY